MRILCLAATLWLASCARPAGGPPEIHYGRDVCARCGMILSEERFASGYVDADGKSVVFDDLGEFIRAAAANRAIIPASFVHDAASGRWLKASEAAYVRAPGSATPMGSGLAALESPERAKTFIRRLGGQGRISTLDEMIACESSRCL